MTRTKAVSSFFLITLISSLVVDGSNSFSLLRTSTSSSSNLVNGGGQQQLTVRKIRVYHRHNIGQRFQPQQPITSSRIISTVRFRGGGGGGGAGNNGDISSLGAGASIDHHDANNNNFDHNNYDVTSTSGDTSSSSAAASLTEVSPQQQQTFNKNIDENLQGITFMALSALSFSLMFLGVKLYSDAPTFTLVFYRSVVQAVLSLLVLLQQQQQPQINDVGKETTTKTKLTTKLLGPTECRNLLIMRGSLGSVAVAAFFYAIQNLPLPDAITLQFTTPVFAAMLAVPLLRESWEPIDQIGTIVCLGGVFLMTRPSWLFGGAATAAAVGGALVPTVVGLVGAALAALAYLMVRKIGTKADANVMVLYYAVISALTAPLGAKFLGGSGGGWNVIGSPSPRDLVVFTGLGVFGFLGQLWTNIGLTKCESAATATLVTNTQIVFALLFEVLVLHESLSPWSVAGTALIVGYMILAGLYKQQQQQK